MNASDAAMPTTSAPDAPVPATSMPLATITTTSGPKRTPPKQKARELATALRGERPDYDYLK